MEDVYLSILKKYWGYDGFRGIQREIIESIGNGRDTLGLMPTGGGKSITFQVPALSRDGICIVVTPLIALMKDQVRNLRGRGIKAAAVYSGLSREEILVTLENCIFGNYKFLYVSPERLASDIFLAKVRHMPVSFLTVDEAHCISQWGYDFRPSYTRIAEIRKILPDIPVLALTATATPEVVKDIQRQLAFREENAFRMSFERKNLAYIVRHTEDKFGELIHILNSTKGSAIVYTRSRRNTRETTEKLQAAGMSATFYHAGLNDAEKDLRQHQWQEDKIRIMVATNAFGMGIDKPDVRSVVHYHPPSSLEAYVQESGRAGRDGLPSASLVMLSSGDGVAVENRLRASVPDRSGVKGLLSSLAAKGEHIVSLYEASAVHDLPDVVVDRILFDLKRRGLLTERGAGYKYYKVRPLFRMEEILCGRDEKESAFLQWLDGHREGQVLDLAVECGISWEEAAARLEDLALSGEWKVEQRQTALLLYSEGFPVNETVEELMRYFTGALHHGLCVSALTAEACLNRRLDEYFGFEKAAPSCGHCPACCGTVPGKMEEEKEEPWPEELRGAVMELAGQRKSALSRPSQMTRFLLGLVSPAAMRSRLWSHPLYGALAERKWKDVWIEARALMDS